MFIICGKNWQGTLWVFGTNNLVLTGIDTSQYCGRTSNVVSGHTPELKVGETRLKYSAVNRTEIYMGLGFFWISVKNYAIRSTEIFSNMPKVL